MGCIFSSNLLFPFFSFWWQLSSYVAERVRFYPKILTYLCLFCKIEMYGSQASCFQVLGCEGWKCTPPPPCSIKHRDERAVVSHSLSHDFHYFCLLIGKIRWWQSCVAEHSLNIWQRAWQQASNSDFHPVPANVVTAAAARAEERVGTWVYAELGAALPTNEQQPFRLHAGQTSKMTFSA